MQLEQPGHSAHGKAPSEDAIAPRSMDAVERELEARVEVRGDHLARLKSGEQGMAECMPFDLEDPAHEVRVPLDAEEVSKAFGLAEQVSILVRRRNPRLRCHVVEQLPPVRQTQRHRGPGTEEQRELTTCREPPQTVGLIDQCVREPAPRMAVRPRCLHCRVVAPVEKHQATSTEASSAMASSAGTSALTTRPRWCASPPSPVPAKGSATSGR